MRSVILLVCCFLCNKTSTAQYCLPDYTVGCNGADIDIDDFILWTTGTNHFIDTATGCSPSPRGHDDRTMRFAPIELTQGTAYHGTIASRSRHITDQPAMKIWIDFNDDEIFQPADSVTTAPAPMYYRNTPYPYTIYIPANADTGVHRMRVRLSTDLNIDPCALQTYGESHDYRVRIVPPPVNDVGVYRILDIQKVRPYPPYPDSVFCHGRPVLFQVVIKNYGSNPQSDFDVQFDFNGVASGSQVIRYTATLPARGQDTITVEFVPPTPGAYTLTAYTLLATDINPRNDPAYKDIQVDASPQRFLRDTAVCRDHFPVILDAGNTECTYAWNVYADARYVLAYAPGLHIVRITSKDDCVTIDTAHVRELPPPSVAGINISGSGSSFIFNAGKPEHVSSFFWELGNGDTAHTDTVHYTYHAPGTYKLRLVVYNDCGTDTADFDIIVFTSSIHTPDAGSSDVVLYPNPVSRVAYIDVPPGMLVEQLFVVDSKGRVVYNAPPARFHSKHAIDVSGMPSGNYVLVIRSSGGYVYKTFSVTEQ